MKKFIIAIGVLSSLSSYAQKKKKVSATPVVNSVAAPAQVIESDTYYQYEEKSNITSSNEETDTPPAIGSYISSSSYDVSNYKDDFGNYKVEYKNLYGLVNNERKLILPIIFNSISVNGNNYQLGIGDYNSFRKYGVYSWTQKKWIIPMIYSYISNIDTNYMIAKKADKYGIIDNQNNIILAFDYDNIESISRGNNDLMRIRKGDKYGIYSFVAGKWIIPLEYNEINSYNFQSKNYFTIKKDGFYNLLNLQNQLIFKNSYTNIEETSNPDIFIVTGKDGKMGIIDSNEKVIVPIENQFIDDDRLRDGSYITRNKDGKIGSIYLDGKVSLPFQYDNYKEGNNDRFITMKDEKCGMIRVNDKSATEVLSCSFDNINFLDSDIMIVEKDKKYGISNSDGNEILPIIYDNILTVGGYYTNENLILQKAKEQWLANINGKIISKAFEKIEKIGEQHEILAYQSGGKEGLLANYGAEYTEPIFEKIIDLRSNNIIVQSNKSFGIYNLIKKTYIVKPEYQTIAFTSDNTIFVYKNGKFETINL